MSAVSKISFTGECCMHALIKKTVLSGKILFFCVGFGEAVSCTTELQRISLAKQTGDTDMFVTPLL